MAEMTIRLRVDPETGKKDIIVSLKSDADSLPHEHEQQHRHLVDQLVEGGLLAEGEVGKVVVEREEESALLDETPREDSQDERRSESIDA